MRKSKIINFFSYIILLLAIIAVFGFVFKFTSGFKTDFTTFYVTVNGEDVMTSKGGYIIMPDTPLSVDVKYTFGFANDELKGYSVKIVPNVDTGKNFSYIVDNEKYAFYGIEDLSNGFEINQGDESFTIKPKGPTLTDFFTVIYGRYVFVDDSCGYEDMFSLLVTSYDGEATVRLDFSFLFHVGGISLDQMEMAF